MSTENWTMKDTPVAVATMGKLLWSVDLFPPGEMPINDLGIRVYGPSKAECLKRARLICAAGPMKEALKGITPTREHEESCGCHHCAARAALALAEEGEK